MLIKRATMELQVYLERKMRDVRDVERLVRDAGELNHRQFALLSDAIRHPESTYTYRSHAASHGVTGETARADLTDLRERGLLQQRKIGRQHGFDPAPDLAKALRGTS